MTTDAESKLMTLKERLEQGQYTVDAKRVADAILRNPLWIMLFAGRNAEEHDQIMKIRTCARSR